MISSKCLFSHVFNSPGRVIVLLIHILQRRPAPMWLATVETRAVRFSLWRAPELPLDEWQYRAARGCCILGGWIDLDITPAIPALAYHATNAASWRLEPYMWGLVYSGPEGLSIVTNLLASAASPQVREEAARSLWITPKIRTPESLTPCFWPHGMWMRAFE